MKRVRSNWLVRLVIFVTGVLSIRLVSTVLHMTTLEKLYKPRDFRKTSHLKIDQKTIDSLPRNCVNLVGQPMDPINLIFVGTESGIRHAFERCGWDGVHPSTPIHLTLGFLSSIFNRSYRKGPFMPLFISVGLQDLAFQKHTRKNKFAERHHVRIWRTRHALKDGRRIWVGAATHEVGMKAVLTPPFVVHKMNPDLDYERDYIAAALIECGHLLADEHQLNPDINKNTPRRNPHGDAYFTDGKAKVVEIV
jgi:hypothetical protein